MKNFIKNPEKILVSTFIVILLGCFGGWLMGLWCREWGLWCLFIGLTIGVLSESGVAYAFATTGKWYPGILLHLIGGGITLMMLLNSTPLYGELGEKVVFGEPFFYSYALEDGEWIEGCDSGIAWYCLYALPIIRVIVIEPIILWRYRKATKKSAVAE